MKKLLSVAVIVCMISLPAKPPVKPSIPAVPVVVDSVEIFGKLLFNDTRLSFQHSGIRSLEFT